MMENKLSLIVILLMIISFLSFTGGTADVEHVTDNVPQLSLSDDDDNSTDNGDDKSDDEDEEDDGDSDDDGVDDDKEEAYEREIEVEYEEDRFRSESELKNGSTRDEFEVEFDVQSDNAAELKFEYSTEIETETSENETELSYEVKFDEIIEFIDTGSPGYQNETQIQVYEIGKTGWNDLVVEYNATSGFVRVNATTLDGVFTLVMKLTSSFLVDDNVTLSPNSLKIDVIINNFDYNTTGTKLALKSQIKTESELSIETESEDEVEGIATKETQVGIKAANATGFFSWAEYALMGNQIIDVLSSSIADSSEEEGETSSKMYFTFNSTAQEDIIWDPKLGVVSEAAKQNLIASGPTTSDTNAEDSTVMTTDQTTSESEPVPDSSALPFNFVYGLILLVGIPVLRRRK